MRRSQGLFAALLLASVAGVANAAPPKSTKKLSAADVERTAREAIALSAPKLPKHATVSGVRCSSSPEVPAMPTRVTIEVTPPPRRAGSAVPATALLVFYKDNDVAARVPITLELNVPPEALVSDVVKGAPVTIVVTHGLVEITAPGVTSSEGDVGDVIQVLLKPSGRAFRAKLVSKDRAQVIE